MSPTIPPEVIGARVTEMYKNIKDQMKSNRGSVVQGTALSLAGWMNNRLGRALDQSAASKGAAAFKGATTVGFHVVSELGLPLISKVGSLCELGIDKGIEHFQTKALKSAFDDVGPDADEAEIMKKQGEYVVLKLAQAVVDAIRKVKESHNKVKDARTNVKDCESFYTYLFACSYLDYRISRLEYYNSMLQTWAQNVDGELKVVNAEWDLLEDQFRKKAEGLVGNYEEHLGHCMNKPYCLFKEEWLHEHVVSEPTLLRGPGGAPVPGAGGPVSKIQKPGLRGPDR